MLQKMHDDEKMTWRQIADLPQFKGIVAAGSLCSFAKGTWEPKDNAIRDVLGLSIDGTLEIVLDGEVVFAGKGRIVGND
jgi:hypothetical protein